jgi:hypothetical protein
VSEISNLQLRISAVATMSIALLKNFLFPRVKHTQRRQRDGSADVDGVTRGPMPGRPMDMSPS